MQYFSERETGEVPRTVEDIPATAWRGIAGLLRTRIEDGSFGARFPDSCPDGAGPCGTDSQTFWDSAFAEIPNLAKYEDSFGRDLLSGSEQPSIVDLMDLIEFCWNAVGKPTPWGHHSFFRHDHLSFDVQTGRGEFREDINRIFRRNGLIYELTDGGSIQRRSTPGLHEPLVRCTFNTGDADLDEMLETARRKILSPDEGVRREALEKLWDAWERVKTVESGQNKSVQVKTLLDRAAGSSGSQFRETLEREATELTRIGNSFQIRHSETTQEPLQTSEHVDFLFHRLFSLIRLVLRTTGRGG